MRPNDTSVDAQKELIDVATSLESAAVAFREKRWHEAEPIYKHAAEVLERIYGPYDPDALSCLQSLGDIYYAMGRFKEAMLAYKRLLSVGEEILGKNDPTVIDMVNRLAMTYQQLGLMHDAEVMFQRVNSANTKNYPDNGAVGSKSNSDRAVRPERLENRMLDDERFGVAPLKTQSSTAPGAAEKVEKGAVDRRNTADAKRAADKKQSKKQSKKQNTSEDDDSDEFDSAGDSGAIFRRSRKRIRTSDYKINPIMDFLISLKGYTSMIMSVIGLIALFICAYVMYSKLGSPVVKVVQKEVKHLKNPSYASADGQVEFSVNKAGMPTFKVRSKPVATTLSFYGPDYWDFKDTIVNSLLNKEIWYEQVSTGLRGEDGALLYEKPIDPKHPSLEFQVINNLNNLQRQMAQNFRVNRRYPTSKEEISWASYYNPVTYTTELPDLTYFENRSNDSRAVINDIPIPSGQTVYDVLESMDNPYWVNEKPPHKGALHCVSVMHSLENNDLREFYAHAFDRNGHLIQGAKANTVYLVGLHNGDENPHARVSEFRNGGRPVRICIIRPPGTNTPIWLLHYFAPLLCLSFSVLFFVGDKLSRPAGQAWSVEKMSASVRLAYVFGLIALVYGVSYFCP